MWLMSLHQLMQVVIVIGRQQQVIVVAAALAAVRPAARLQQVVLVQLLVQPRLFVKLDFPGNIRMQAEMSLRVIQSLFYWVCIGVARQSN